MASKIMVIDDDPEFLEMIKMILQAKGYVVDCVESGQEAIDKFNGASPDLIILDVMMPGMDGYETCARLRQMTEVPILMLTAKATHPDMITGFDHGVDDFVTKPFGQAELLARIRALLRRSPRANQ